MLLERQIRPPFAAILTAAAAALCGACDTLYGIQRDTRLTFLPDLACVEAAIRSIAEVRDVRQWSVEGARPLTLTGIQAPDRLHYFGYDVGSTGATLLLSIDYEGDVEMSQHLVRINRHVPQADVDAVRPVMLRIEAALEERCGVKLGKISEYNHP